MPISGDQVREWRFFAVISTFPRSTTFSRVKKVKAVIMVNNKPIIKMTIPAFFICFFLNNIDGKIKKGRSKSVA
jgi:hypothetical protein